MQGRKFLGRDSILGLDVIRFFAALAVMWFHLAYYSWAEPNSPSGKILSELVEYRALAATSWWGWVGVHIFFVISGFVIAYSAEGKSAAAFFRSRFLRLYPAAWVCATLTLIVLALMKQTSNLGLIYIKSITLFPLQPWVDAVYWTLGVEMSFYGTVFFFLWRNKFKDLPILLTILGLASSAMWIFWLLSGYEMHIFRSTRLSELLLIPYGCHFAIGGFIWLNTRQPLTRWQWGVSSISCVGGAIGVYSLSLKSAFSPFVPVAIWTLATLAIFLVVAFNQCITKYLGKHVRLFRTIGLSTYPLYLVHDVVGAAVVHWGRSVGMSQVVALVIGILAVVVLSIIIATTLEPLLRRWTARILPTFMNGDRAVPTSNYL